MKNELISFAENSELAQIKKKVFLKRMQQSFI